MKDILIALITFTLITLIMVPVAFILVSIHTIYSEFTMSNVYFVGGIGGVCGWLLGMTWVWIFNELKRIDMVDKIKRILVK